MSGVAAVTRVFVRLPSEESVSRWLIVVLGPRAMVGAAGTGEVALAGRLKDGAMLVRLAKAIGGARTASVPKVM